MSATNPPAPTTPPNRKRELGPEAKLGYADTDTPIHSGRVRHPQWGPGGARFGSKFTPAPAPINYPSAAPSKSTRLKMDHCLEDEFRGAIFCDPKFVANFLTINGGKWPLLEKELKGPKKCVLDKPITKEKDLYRPILNCLRLIKSAVDVVRIKLKLEPLGTNVEDYHATTIPGDDPYSKFIKPDLVLFEDNDRRSWETLMMPIEVKKQHTYLKVGMKQLAKYACAVFAHQIHRRHLYGIVICKWAATFVRFDRSGILHSEPIDMLHNPEEFRKAFAGLMMLDRHAFGYDTAFTVEYTPGEQLEYYVDLPTTVFPSDDTEPGTELVAGPRGDFVQQTPTPQRFPTRKFKAVERLCHRKDIRGCATIVLRLREAQISTAQPKLGPITRSHTRLQSCKTKWEEIPGGREYVLKLVWRDSTKRNEGDILKRLEGEYGVIQCRWYSDILRWGASCHEPEATSCDTCSDMTPAQIAVRKVNNLGDLDVKVTQEQEGKDPRYVEVDTEDYVGESDTYRTARIYSWTLFPTVGRPLRTAESPRQFLEAVLDAVLGYWQALNRGILHRDISDGNVLIADPGQGYKLRKWKLEQELIIRNGQQTTGEQNHPLAESRRLAQETIMQLGRDPIGFLSDFNLAAMRTEMESEASGDAPAKRRHSYSWEFGAEDVADAGPPTKRLKRNDEASSLLSASATGNVQEEGKSGEHNLSSVTVPRRMAYGPIDYRTGTPPFMSIRVLEVKPGTPYEHHFMDDLQSFFWLILWCVIAHMDPSSDENGNGSQRTEEASTLLHKLDRPDSDFSTMADSKRSLLIDCINGGGGLPCTMVEKLACCGNSWANNRAIVDVIVNLGVYFRPITATRNRFLKCTPATEFPKVVGIISEGLKNL